MIARSIQWFGTSHLDQNNDVKLFRLRRKCFVATRVTNFYKVHRANHASKLLTFASPWRVKFSIETIFFASVSVAKFFSLGTRELYLPFITFSGKIFSQKKKKKPNLSSFGRYSIPNLRKYLFSLDVQRLIRTRKIQHTSNNMDIEANYRVSKEQKEPIHGRHKNTNV